MTYEAKITTSNHIYSTVSIVSVTYGYSRRLKDGVWVNCTAEPERCEEVILTLGKTFLQHADAEKFITTKAFKSLLKQVAKGGLI